MSAAVCVGEIHLKKLFKLYWIINVFSLVVIFKLTLFESILQVSKTYTRQLNSESCFLSLSVAVTPLTCVSPSSDTCHVFRNYQLPWIMSLLFYVSFPVECPVGSSRISSGILKFLKAISLRSRAWWRGVGAPREATVFYEILVSPFGDCKEVWNHTAW